MADIGGAALINPTPGATVSIAIPIDVRDILCSWTASENEIINLSGTQKNGQYLVLKITNDALARTITMGTGLVSTGVMVGTALKIAQAIFRSDGSNFIELSRTLGM